MWDVDDGKEIVYIAPTGSLAAGNQARRTLTELEMIPQSEVEFGKRIEGS